MFVKNWRWTGARGFLALLMSAVLMVSTTGCGDRSEARTPGLSTNQSSVKVSGGKIAEVSPPETIQILRQSLEKYQPQVAIASPRPNEMLQDTTVAVRFQVQDLPIFKNKDLDMGPHLHVILDNQPYQAVYDITQPLVLKDVTPGTHTLRVFASRPWHESFKNEGAYAQVTFHVFTKTQDNNPSSELPLLTYSRPKGDYGAEPIMLDFYLTNAPLHLVAQENPNDEIADWRIRCTINGQSFVLDRWQPLYLKGFNPGKNWVQLEFLDEQGNLVDNAFNNTARAITYEPEGQDTLSKLIRGEISAEQARGIVDPTYQPKITEPVEAPEPTPVPDLSPVPELTPPVIEEPAVDQPVVEPSLIEPSPIEPELPTPLPLESPSPEPAEPEVPESKVTEEKPSGFFNRFRRSAPAPVVPSPESVPEVPAVIEAPQNPIPLPAEQLPLPEPELEEPSAPEPAQEPEEEPEQQPLEPTKPVEPEKPGFFNRFRRSAPFPVLPSSESAPEVPAVIEAPAESATPENRIPMPAEQPPMLAPEPEVEEPTAAPEAPSQEPESPLPISGFLNRFRRPTAPSVVPTPNTVPGVIEAPAESATPENRIPMPAEQPPMPAPEPEVEEPTAAPEAPSQEPESPLPISGFLNRFRRPASPSVVPTPNTVPGVIEAPAESATPENRIPMPAEQPPMLAPEPEVEEPTAAPEAPSQEPESPLPISGFLNRFRRPTAPSVVPTPNTVPGVIEAPETQFPALETESPATLEEPSSAASESEAPVAPEKPELTEAGKRIEQLKAGGIFDRLRREPANSVLPVPAKPSVLPGALPEITKSQPSEAPIMPTEELSQPAIAPVSPSAPKPNPLKSRTPEPGLPQPAPERKFPIIQSPVQPNSSNLQSLKERLMQPEPAPEPEAPIAQPDEVSDQTPEDAVNSPDEELQSIEIP